MTRHTHHRNRALAALTSRGGLGALALFVVAAVVFFEVSGLRIGSTARMGPGYFPALLGGLFVLFGVLLLIEGWRNPDERIDVGPMRPVILLLLGIVLFAVLYRFVGGALAIGALVIVAALAERERTWREMVGLVVVVVALVWLVFVAALDLQLTMLPPWMMP